MIDRSHRILVVALAVMLAIGATGLVPSRALAAPATAPGSPFRYFGETGHNIGTRVKTFYEQNGDVAVFGLPLTEVIREGNLDVQYFERAKIELHPEFDPNFYVSLTHLGRAASGNRTDGPFAPVPAGVADPNTTYFPDTGHNLSYGFREYWRTYGGVRIFGLPISEEFPEVSPDDGQTYTVQYFERAKFEYHAGSARPIQLARLGALALDKSGHGAAVRAPAQAIKMLGEATTGYYGSIAERVNNIARAASRMNGQIIAPGQTFSFNQALGPAGPDEGYVEGYAIVNGQLEKVLGGGICQVSTTMYRAIYYAGLDIVERYPHSYVINFYENIDGFDATVFSPTVDFRWRNDTSAPIYMMATTNVDAATVTFSIWGVDDGRTTTMVGPKSKILKQQGVPAWQYDPNLKRGEIKQLVHGRPGMQVQMGRVVTAASGKTLHNDNLPSTYKPWEDFYVYGPGVTPPKGVTIVPPKKK